MYSNFVHTCAEGVGPSFVSDSGTSFTISDSLTNSLFFKRFMLGCHRRMGDVWKPDAQITKDILEVCFDILEKQWEVYVENNDSVEEEDRINGLHASVWILWSPTRTRSKQCGPWRYEPILE